MVALVRLEVGHVLHARLDSLRHELRLLLGRLQSVEELSQASAVSVVGDGEADPAARVTAIDRHAGRAKLDRDGGFAVFATLGGRRVEDPIGWIG